MVTSDGGVHDLEYPSLTSVRIFWKLAQEEFSSDSIFEQKQACDKAYRAVTEAVDTLLAFHGKYVPVGTPEAHITRTKYLTEFRDVIPEGREIDTQYSLFKDKLHGAAYYSGLDPKIFREIFESVSKFISQIEKATN